MTAHAPQRESGRTRSSPVLPTTTSASRTVNKYQIPFLVAGCGGHSPLAKMRATYRTPYKIDNTLTLESYDDADYSYLRVIVNATTMSIEFHPQNDGGTTKTPNDTVAITLANHMVS